MAWNSLPTLANGGTPTFSQMNMFLENLEWLDAPPTDSYAYTGTANYTTSSTNWASISSDFELSLVTSGGHVLVGASVGATRAEFDVRVDGTRLGTSPSASGTGIMRNNTTAQEQMNMMLFLPGLSAGTHTFNLEWKATTATATIDADYQPRFFAREL